MEGIQFVRGDHLSIGDGCYLPRADLFGQVESHLHQVLFHHPELKSYIPNLMDVDLFISWDEDKFLLFVSTQKRGHIPQRGMESKHLPAERAKGLDPFAGLDGFVDISHLDVTKQSFAQLGFIPGFAAAGKFPHGIYTDGAKAAQAKAGEEIVKLIEVWANARRRDMENSRIFLSHKGINKPLIEKIDSALRMLNLKTWFDRDDLVAGDPLVRGVDNAFSKCSAAVFFISGDYVDAGVIQREIDRALHEAAMRKDPFRIIPLVLAQHRGEDAHVPAPLQTLVWKTVNDIEIVPSILRGLPDYMQRQVRYEPAK